MDKLNDHITLSSSSSSAPDPPSSSSSSVSLSNDEAISVASHLSHNTVIRKSSVPSALAIDALTVGISEEKSLTVLNVPNIDPDTDTLTAITLPSIKNPYPNVTHQNETGSVSSPTSTRIHHNNSVRPHENPNPSSVPPNNVVTVHNPSLRTRHASFTAGSSRSTSTLDNIQSHNNYRHLNRSISPSPSTNRTYSPLRRHGSGTISSRNPSLSISVDHLSKLADGTTPTNNNSSNNGRVSGTNTPRERGASLGADIGDIAIEAAVAVLEADALHSQQRGRTHSHSNSYDFSSSPNPISHPFLDALDSVLDSSNHYIGRARSISPVGEQRSSSTHSTTLSPNANYPFIRTSSDHHHDIRQSSCSSSDDVNQPNDHASDSDDSDDENHHPKVSPEDAFVSTVLTRIDTNYDDSRVSESAPSDITNDTATPIPYVSYDSENLQKANALLLAYHEKTLQKIQFHGQHTLGSASSANVSLRSQPERIPRVPLTSNHPNWANDANCQHCGIKFTMLRRKHHCRGCGSVLCSTCSPHNTTISHGINNSNTNSSNVLTAFAKGKFRVCRRCRALQSGRVLRSKTEPLDHLTWLDAIASGDTDEIETRIMYGQDVNAVCTEDDNYTALHVAAGITAFLASQQRQHTVVPYASFSSLSDNASTLLYGRKTTVSSAPNDTTTHSNTSSGRQSPLLSFSGAPSNGGNEPNDSLASSLSTKNGNANNTTGNNNNTSSNSATRSPFFSSFGSAISKLAGFSLSSSSSANSYASANESHHTANGSPALTSLSILTHENDTNALARGTSHGTDSVSPHSSIVSTISPLSLSTGPSSTVNVASIQSWWENRTEVERISVNIIQLLLREGAYVNSQSASRRTPLHIAAMHGTVRAVQILLEAGALQSAKDKNDCTPYDYAEVRALRGDTAGKQMVDYILDRTHSSRLSNNHAVLLQNSEDATVRRINMLTHIRTHLLIRAKLQQTNQENDKSASNSSTDNSPTETLETSSASTVSSNHGNDPSSHDSSSVSTTASVGPETDLRKSPLSLETLPSSTIFTDPGMLSYSHNLDILSLVPNNEPVVGIASGESNAVLTEASMLSRAQSLPIPSKETLMRMNIQVLESAAQTLQANLMSVREGYERWLLEHDWTNRYAIASSVFTDNRYDTERIKLGPVPAIDVSLAKERNIYNHGIYTAYFVSKTNHLGLTTITSRFEPGWLRVQELTGKLWAQGHPTVTYGDVTEYIETAFRTKQGSKYIRPVGLGPEYDPEYDNIDGEEGGPDYDPDTNASYHPSYHQEVLDDERSQISSDSHDKDTDARGTRTTGPDNEDTIVHRSSIHRRRTISTLSTESSSSTTTTDLDSSVNSSSSDENPSLNSSVFSSIDADTNLIGKEDNENYSGSEKKPVSPSKENSNNTLDSSYLSTHSEGSGVMHVSLDAFVNGTVVPITNANDNSSTHELPKSMIPVPEETVPVPAPRPLSLKISSPSRTESVVETGADSSASSIGPPPPLRLSTTLSPLRLTAPLNSNRSVSAPDTMTSDAVTDEDYRPPIIREDGKLQINVNTNETNGQGLTHSLSRLRLNTDPEVAAHLRAKALQEEVDRESLASLSPRSMSMDGTVGYPAFTHINSFELSPGMGGNNASSQPFGITNNSTALPRVNSLSISPFGLGRSTSVDTGFSPLLNSSSSSSPGIRSILKRTGSFMSPSMNTNMTNTPNTLMMSPMTLNGIAGNSVPQSSPLLLPNHANGTQTSSVQISPSSSVVSIGTDTNSSVSGSTVNDTVMPTQSALLSPLLINPTTILPARSVRLSGSTSFELPPSVSDGLSGTKGFVIPSTSFAQSRQQSFTSDSGPFGSGADKNHNDAVTNYPKNVSHPSPESESTFYFGGNLTRSSSDSSVSSNETSTNNYPFNLNYTDQGMTSSQSGLSVSDMISRYYPSLENLAPARSPALSFASVSSTGSGLRRNVSFRDRGGSVVSDVFTYAPNDRKARRSVSHETTNKDDEHANQSFSSDDDNDSNGSVNGSDNEDNNQHGGSGGEDTDSESGHDNASAFAKNARIRSTSPTGFLSSGARTSRAQPSEGINAEGSQTSRLKALPSTKIVSAIPSRVRALLSGQNDGDTTTEDEDTNPSETRATTALTSSSSFRNNSVSLRSPPPLSFISPSELLYLSNSNTSTKSFGNGEIVVPLSPSNVLGGSGSIRHSHSHRSNSSHASTTPTGSLTSSTSSSLVSHNLVKANTAENTGSSLSLNLKLSSSSHSLGTVPGSRASSFIPSNGQVDDTSSSSSDEGYRTDSDEDIDEEEDDGTSNNVNYGTHSNSVSSTKGTKATGAPKATGGPPVAQLTPKMMAIIASMAASRSNSNTLLPNMNGQAYYGQHQRSPTLPVHNSGNVTNAVPSTLSSTGNSTASSIDETNNERLKLPSLTLGTKTTTEPSSSGTASTDT